jgi:hypothetical protein
MLVYISIATDSWRLDVLSIEVEDSPDAHRKIATTANYLRSILSPDYEARQRLGAEAHRALMPHSPRRRKRAGRAVSGPAS